MEYKDIKKLMEDMGMSKLSEMEIQFADGTKISLKKHVDEVIKRNNSVVKVTEEIASELIEKEKDLIDGNIVKSPMVGTFYSKPSPSADAFVKLGDKIKKGDKLCIIEAMKLMNEIESEFDGEIVEIFVKDNEAVDYGMPMFKIRKQ